MAHRRLPHASPALHQPLVNGMAVIYDTQIQLAYND
jgi:hypothetical protein